jgi:hypothetical protein
MEAPIIISIGLHHPVGTRQISVATEDNEVAAPYPNHVSRPTYEK